MAVLSVTRPQEARAMLVDSLARRVVFVVGPPNSGKTHFIERCLPDYVVIEPLGPAAEAASVDSETSALIQAIRQNKKVVLEHRLAKAHERAPFVRAARSILGRDASLTCWYSLPSLEEYSRYDRLAYESWMREHPDDMASFPTPADILQHYRDEFEIPTVAEGFTRVKRVQDVHPLPRHTPDAA